MDPKNHRFFPSLELVLKTQIFFMRPPTSQLRMMMHSNEKKKRKRKEKRLHSFLTGIRNQR